MRDYYNTAIIGKDKVCASSDTPRDGIAAFY